MNAQKVLHGKPLPCDIIHFAPKNRTDHLPIGQPRLCPLRTTNGRGGGGGGLRRGGGAGVWKGGRKEEEEEGVQFPN